MYCFGDCRSETFSFSPRASRSRSRWRIFSRSSATDFMRLSSTSGDSTGMASVSTVAIAATAASSAVSCLTPMPYIESISVQSMDVAQKSKLIICFMTKTPMPIHTAHPAIMKRPRSVGPKQFDVVRAGQPDERADADRQRADDRRRGLGFHRHGLDLGLHLLAVAQHARQVAERFGQVAAGLLLDRDDDAEEVGFRQRHALVELGAGFADRHADGLRLDDRPEFALDRLLRVERDDLQAVEQRQAGLDAAHDHVDAVREMVEEFLFAALLEKRQQPARQAEGGGKADAERRQQARRP